MDFTQLYFPLAHMARRFESSFMCKSVTPSYFVDINEFKNIIICGRSVTGLLRQWELALSVDEPIYEILVRVFYSNMVINDIRSSRMVI